MAGIIQDDLPYIRDGPLRSIASLARTNRHVAWPSRPLTLKRYRSPISSI